MNVVRGRGYLHARGIANSNASIQLKTQNKVPCSNLSIETVMINHETRILIIILCTTFKNLLVNFFFCDTERFGADQSGAKYIELQFSIQTLRKAAKIKL